MIITIVGPTGVGKTRLSLELAKKYNGEIINADSTQIYKEINIGTAKIEDMEGIHHHLINIRNLNEEYTAYDYQKEARVILEDILNRGKTPIIVGGSGLYLSALLYDYNFSEDSGVYDFDSLSDEEMHTELTKMGIEVDKNNRQRLIRKYAKHINNSEPINSGGQNLVYQTKIIGLTTNRDTLYDKINTRVDQMIEAGLIGEVRALFNKYPNSKQLKTTIDYKEFIPYLNKECYLEEVLVKMKQNSRNYAKRQYTWLNHKMNVNWFETDYENFNKTILEIIDYLEN